METRRDPARSTTAPLAAPYYVRGLALGIPALLLGLQITGWLFFIPAIVDGHADFRNFYSAGHMVRSGDARALYDYQTEKFYQDRLISRENMAMPFIHPAYEALLFVPLSLLPYRAAYFAFLTVNLGLLAICYRLLHPHMQNLEKVWRGLPAGMFLFLPVTGALMKGQDSILLLTLLAAAAVCLGEGREFSAGVLIALGLFRFQVVLPIAILFLIWRRWRFSAGFAVAATVLAAVSVGVAGVAQTESYARSLLSISGSGSVADLVRYAQPDWQMANLRGLIVGLAGSHLSLLWMRRVILLVSGAVLLLVAGLTSRGKGANLLPIAITASAAVSYHFLFHDLSVLLIPIVFALDRFVTAEATGDPAGRLAARTAAVMFLAPIAVSFAPEHYYLVALPLCALLLVLIQHSRREPTGAMAEAL
jgi:glycosyl transferase family 87